MDVCYVRHCPCPNQTAPKPFCSTKYLRLEAAPQTGGQRTNHSRISHRLLKVECGGLGILGLGVRGSFELGLQSS